MKNKKGKVYIIGAGPGHPELITVKGLSVLRKAGCILYDFLSSPDLLGYAKKSSKKICVGKKDGLHLKEQGQINSLLYSESKKHDIVARLKGGDPFIFSRGFEEARFLADRGVDVEVIPGVTSAISGPETCGIPLTIKNRISSVAILTGRKKDKKAPIDAPDCKTLIYLMAVGNISNVIKALRMSGRRPEEPCAFIEKATRPDSRITYATLSTAEDAVKKAGIQPPAVLVVGEVVDHGRKI